MQAQHLGLLAVLAGLLAGCAAPSTPTAVATAPPPSTAPEVALPNYGPAPELTNDVWLNTDQPLRLAGLRGQVVLIDMWTFG